MNVSLFVLLVANLLMIALLPRVFFRRDGTFNVMWFVTALPIFVGGVGLILCQMGWLRPWITAGTTLAWVCVVIGTLLSLMSWALLFFTLGTHRIPLALWHQSNDAPRHIVTWGAYRRIRHPFYTSFLLALLAIAIASPHPVTIGAWLYALIILTLTAAREERNLCGSEFATEYRTYMGRSGRFFPYLGHIPHD